MDKVVEELCAALERLSGAVLAVNTEERTMREVHGWAFPAVTRVDTAAIPHRLAKALQEANPEALDEQLTAILATYPRRLKLMQSETLPNLFAGNQQAVSAYFETLRVLEFYVEPLIGWVSNPDKARMPAGLARRLRAYEAILDGLEPDAQRLGKRLSQIEAAHEALEALPVDMETLRREKKNVNELAEQVKDNASQVRIHLGDTTVLTKRTQESADAAEKLIRQCDEALRIVTTAGLAGAFDDRAKKAENSMLMWVVALIASLAAATILGGERVRLLSDNLTGVEPRWGVIVLQAILSVLSVAAPLWFAWVSTKQISHRFRLTEDYAFKASVAKAYEGYRREAVRIDPEFEARLFGSALSRLEEPPLRLVAHDSHGSPWHELLDSPAMQRAMEAFPELRDKVGELAAASLNVVKSRVRKQESNDANTP